jgi:hypothetical protein
VPWISTISPWAAAGPAVASSAAAHAAAINPDLTPLPVI